MDKAAFVSGLQGGEPAELVVVMSLLATGFLLHRAVCFTLRCSRGLLALLVEILCIPILLCVGFTLLEDWLIELSGLCIALSLLMLAHALPTASNGAPEYAEDKSSPWSTLTVYRGGMMLATCVSILAVDFAVYPRRFAKTEEYGFSLMDVGVGSFVFSSGLAARRPLSGRDSVWQIMRDSGIVLLLGVGRFVLTELTAYPQHVSEYGTHWNFFLTMGLISMGVRLFDATSWPHVGWAGLGLLTLHQLPTCLFPSLLEWLLNAPRDSWISHNREGLLGLPGFAALVLLALAAARRLRHGQPLVPVAALSALLGMAAHFLIQNASRRLVNAAYVLTTVALNCFLLALLSLVDQHCQPSAEQLLPAVSQNQLPVFLAANLMTGAVNLSIDTIAVSNTAACALLIVYITIVCAVALSLSKLRKKRPY